MESKKALNALLRSDLSLFIERTFLTVAPGEEYFPNWHIDAIAWHLQQCAEGKIRRLIITLPPRYMKSIAVSVAFPAWLLGRDPTKKIICASYSNDLAAKHADDFRAVMGSPWYRSAFPRTRLQRDRTALAEMITTLRGYRMCTSVGGTLTGRGGNMIIIDDPHKADEGLSDTKRDGVISWFRNTVVSRLNRKSKDVIILVQQRLHESDLAGYLLEQGGWHHLDIPAIAETEQTIPVGEGQCRHRVEGDVLHPERESLQDLEALRVQLGSYTFSAQYQQRPAPLGGGILKWEWFKHFDRQPEKGRSDQIIQSWDIATKADESNDWSVCTTWLMKNPNFYLLHLSRHRLEYPELKRRVLDEARLHKPDLILIEDKAAGSSLIQDVQCEPQLIVVPIDPKEDKETRAMMASPPIEGGRVFLPDEAGWLADFQREVVGFPRGKHDDQVDSLSQFLLWAKDRLDFSTAPVMVIKSRFAAEREEFYRMFGPPHYHRR